MRGFVYKIHSLFHTYSMSTAVKKLMTLTNYSNLFIYTNKALIVTQIGTDYYRFVFVKKRKIRTDYS